MYKNYWRFEPVKRFGPPQHLNAPIVHTTLDWKHTIHTWTQKETHARRYIRTPFFLTRAEKSGKRPS